MTSEKCVVAYAVVNRETQTTSVLSKRSVANKLHPTCTVHVSFICSYDFDTMYVLRACLHGGGGR